METKNEIGITLIALIITVIILVILSAVAISTVYNSRIVELAIKGAKDYTQEGINENYVLDETGSLIDSVMNNFGKKPGERKYKSRNRRSKARRTETQNKNQRKNQRQDRLQQTT